MADPNLADAVDALRELILAAESYRLATADYLGLTISESQAVSYLLARGELGQGELGAALGFNSSSTTALVDRLERNAIAERVPDPHDRRRSLVRLSQSGHAALDAVRSWMEGAFSDVAAAELTALTETIDALSRGLRSTAKAIPTTAEFGAHPKPARRR